MHDINGFHGHGVIIHSLYSLSPFVDELQLSDTRLTAALQRHQILFVELEETS